MPSKTTGFLVLFALFFSCQSKQSVIDQSTVKQLDLDRYLGTWHEIARFQHSFEKDLVGVTATYSLRDDGKIKVVNAGYKNTLDGPYKEAVGKAKIPNPDEPGQLKVAFFLFFYAAYNVLELDEDYQYALIGSSTPDYLWILSRTPQLDEKTYQQLVDKAAARGYDTSKLFKVPQNQPAKPSES
ncbi:lipocalin family protein [Sunxiuqinia rutila]|uniref:lipocalin family protein n=1 Tax=Sunxiuqinia rutila TaxID=1397841 RepID=UPI003D368FF5